MVTTKDSVIISVDDIFKDVSNTEKTVVSSSVDDATLNMIDQLCSMQGIKRAEVIRKILVHYRKKLGRTTDFQEPK